MGGGWGGGGMEMLVAFINEGSIAPMKKRDGEILERAGYW